MMTEVNSERFAFLKPSLDAHTLGMNTAAELLRSCGYIVVTGDEKIENAINEMQYEVNRSLLVEWIRSKKINILGLSYRLDYHIAVSMVGYLMHELQKNSMLSYQGGQIKGVFFAGLPKSCEIIDKEHKGFVKTFIGGESIQETLIKMNVPLDRIPKDIKEGSLYDDKRMEFGRSIIKGGKYESFKPTNRSGYSCYGTKNDTIEKRIDNNLSISSYPITRAHVGPYSSSLDRIESVKEFISWAKQLSEAGYLDILSIGTSQLTQSNFGENWDGKPNGGGVPINSPEEYCMIYEASRPLLVRTYAGTKNTLELAKMHERTINICWHALSLWWFNKLDNRGPYDLLTNLKQHYDTLKYIAITNKPFEPNVPHHFAFRGADDVTYIVSAYLSAKLAKKTGVKTLILQNMLNTPRSTWGIQDLAKSRAMLALLKNLEDSNFRIILQPRAGLDYFKTDLHEAKIQLAAVTALMDDIKPTDNLHPAIIHVVSYSEASYLATPEVINESIKITQYSLKEYRNLRKKGHIEDMSKNEEVYARTMFLIDEAETIIKGIEKSINHLYTPEGFYRVFAGGFLPVPYLWGCTEELKHAIEWKTSPYKGGIRLVDKDNNPISANKRVDIASNNLKEVEYNLNEIYRAL